MGLGRARVRRLRTATATPEAAMNDELVTANDALLTANWTYASFP